jgi:hypothetical protein
MKDSEILKAWMAALAAAQPEYGPLLQSTVDEVGALPAAGGRGAIYTISHDRYVAAEAYSKAYVTEELKYTCDLLIEESEEARKNSDELTMVQKEDEVRFWTDVSDWIKSRGAARIRPEPIPAWITKLNIEFEP